MNRSYKVLHAPTTVGGNPQGLSEALNSLGVYSRTLALRQNYINYPADYVLWSEKDGLIKRELKRLATLIHVAVTYDVIHYNSGTTIACPVCSYKPGEDGIMRFVRWVYSKYTSALQLFELKIYKALGKSLFVTYQGDDARQGDYSLANFRFNIASQVEASYYYKESDEFKRRSIDRLSQYCISIYAVNPDLLHVLPMGAKFVPYSNIILDDWVPQYTQVEERKLRIVHAPSHRGVKGTDLILAALDNLKAEGFEFELVLVEGLSNEKAKKIYEAADVLVDQLFAGWYGGLAVEAMALGKPVLVYIRSEDLKFIPDEMVADLPFVNVNPETLEDGLRKVLTMPREELLALGKRGRTYVEKWHNPMKIAAEIRGDYEAALSKRFIS
jgi:glycosyltransferase involved in cell wall biosynthesis